LFLIVGTLASRLLRSRPQRFVRRRVARRRRLFGAGHRMLVHL